MVRWLVAHHTKDKGDVGVAKAHADLAAQGFVVLLPLTEHAPFDLVAYRDGEFWRVQVKYRAARRGAVRADFISTWSDTHGVHKQLLDKALVDILCVYCPDTDACYYVEPRAYRDSVTLRVSSARNGQMVGVNLASTLRLMPGGRRMPATDGARVVQPPLFIDVP